MAKEHVSFTVAVPFDAVQAVFTPAIDHWVANMQDEVSPTATAMTLGTALHALHDGRGLTAAWMLTRARGHGVKHPTRTTAHVAIPASMSTFGGTMTVVATPSAAGGTTITIDGRTQGFWRRTVRQHVSGLATYLYQVVAALAHQDSPIPAADDAVWLAPALDTAASAPSPTTAPRWGWGVFLGVLALIVACMVLVAL